MLLEWGPSEAGTVLLQACWQAGRVFCRDLALARAALLSANSLSVEPVPGKQPLRVGHMLGASHPPGIQCAAAQLCSRLNRLSICMLRNYFRLAEPCFQCCLLALAEQHNKLNLRCASMWAALPAELRNCLVWLSSWLCCTQTSAFDVTLQLP